MKPISVQLYTLRDAAALDFHSVLTFLADTGYKGVEFAGLHGHSANEVAGWLKDLGLVTSSSHVGFPTLENINQLVDTEKTLGNTHLVSGFGPAEFATADECRRTAHKMQAAAELVSAHGMSFGMHNHWWEFEQRDGRLGYEIILEEAPNVFSELDIYWAAFAGENPADVVSKHKGRLPLLHIKDGPLVKDAGMTAVGSGKVDIKAAIQAADPSVLQWLIVELDACDTDMKEAVAQSYAYLTSNQLASGNK